MYHELKQHFSRFMPEIKEKVSDVYGRVLHLSDFPDEGQPSNFDRPALSATVQVLNIDGSERQDVVFTSLPVPASESSIAPPRKGDLVLIGFVYGSPRHPVIKAVYRNGSMLPNVKDGEQWLGNSDNYQLSNHAGWFRSALNLISDTSFKRKVKAFESEIEYGRETKKVTGLWHTFAGTIVFKSLGSLRLLAGSVLNISALKKINISSKEVTVIKSAKIYLGSDSNDVIDLLIQLIDKVKELDKAVVEHVHKSTVPGSPTSNALNPDETPLVGFKADFNSIEKPLKDIKYTPTD